MGRFVAIVALAMLAVGCSELPTATSTTPPTATSSTTLGNTDTTTTTTEAVPVPGCEGAPDAYTSEGPVAIIGDSQSDASQISSLLVEPSGECERLEIGLQTAGGAPATALPEVRVEILPDSGVVRVRFPQSIRSTAITESILESAYVRRAYVVRALEGGLFVDLHVSEPVSARALELRNPARAAVELRPGGAPLQSGPAVAERVVVTEPGRRTVDYPLLISGYARTFEASVIARVVAAGTVEAEYVTTAADYLETWGEFAIEIPDGPGGEIAIFVGEDAPGDGSPTGVTIELSAG